MQKRSKGLRFQRENVCLAVSAQDRLYAVGSQSHVTLVDDRVANEVAFISSQQRGSGEQQQQHCQGGLVI